MPNWRQRLSMRRTAGAGEVPVNHATGESMGIVSEFRQFAIKGNVP
jgi:hypothetical protein